ncbi:MAG: DUF2288 domain-containing protein [Halioglobus sp.]|nr:DUF2288 domain-containing protein [Halioglobus sp.]
MADEDAREQRLRCEYQGQTARIPWHDLQIHYARGSVISVASRVDLIDVAVQLGMDNTAALQQWMDASVVVPVSESQAQGWYEADAILWAVVAAPWVLVQEHDAD